MASAPLSPAPPGQALICAPHASRRGRLLRHTLVGLAIGTVFLVYVATAAPGAWWGDGLEFACAAWTLGIPHPPGYPLYTTSGHAVIKMLGGLDPGRALTIWGAALLALSIGLMIPFFRRLLSEDAPADSPKPCVCDLANLLPAVGLGLLLAFSNALWDQATYTDVFPLTFLFGVLIVRLCWTGRDAHPELGRAAALGLVVGLAALNHYSIFALYPLAFFCILCWAWRSGRPWRMLLVALVCFLIPLAGYLYLPLRARVNPPLNWGDPSNFSRLLWVLRGGQFREFRMSAGFSQSLAGLAVWLRWWGTQWIPLSRVGTPLAMLFGVGFLAVAGAGLIALARRRWELGAGLLIAIAATACYGAFYHILDIDSYFLVALPAALAGWVFAVQWGLERLRARGGDLGRRPLPRALPALAALLIMLTHYGAIDKSWDTTPYDWGARVMEALPKDALVLCGGDNDLYPLWYQQMVLGRRPDVTVFGANWIFSGFYRKYFEAAGRPKIPMRIQDRPVVQNKYEFEASLFQSLILPNLAQGRRVFATYNDEALFNYFDPQPVAALMPPQYLAITGYPFPDYLPAAQLYELRPNPVLAGMDPAALELEIKSSYQIQHAASGPPPLPRY